MNIGKLLLPLLFSFSLSLLPLNSLQAQAAAEDVDSLKLSLTQHPVDSNTVDALADIAMYYRAYYGYNQDSAFRYAHKLRVVGFEIDNVNAKIMGTRELAYYHWGMGNLDSAMTYVDQCLEILPEINDEKEYQQVLYVKAQIYKDYGLFAKSQEINMQVLEYFESQNSPSAAVILNAIGNVHGFMLNHKEAEEAYRRALEIARTEGDSNGIAVYAGNLGTELSHVDRLDEAQELFEEALEVDILLKDTLGMGYQYVNVGMVHFGREEYEEALDYVLKGLEIREKLGQKLILVTSLEIVGRVLVKMERYDEAISYLLRAKAIAEEIETNTFYLEVHEGLGRAYKGKGDYETSLAYWEKAYELRAEAYSKEKSDKIQELTRKYEADKREAEIVLLSTENELKDSEAQVRNASILGLLLLLGVGGLIAWFRGRRLQHQKQMAVKDKELKETEFNQTRTELELKALRAQMNPHFVFNCMNSINRLILEDKNEEASRNLGKFSRLIRMILEHSEKEKISLQEELEMLETYIQLESQRFKGRIDYEFEIDPELDAEDVMLPSMVLQPFIENAIWHGLMHKEDQEGKISIKLKEEGDFLHCSIEDDGVGREKSLELKSKTAEHKSMAIKVTQERLGLLGKEDAGDLIRIVDLKNESNQGIGTRVELSIPI